ncbi:MAG: hypothetical protein AAGK14_08610 [Verrucomicrobiota bacterium]
MAWAAGDADFGSQTRTNDAALIGIFYDLKQDQQRRGTGMDDRKYMEVLDRFLRENWNEAVLNRYFRATRPLYATQIFITGRGAGAAPKAFGVEKVVSPQKWVAHYKGQVAAPSTGNWRFWGSGDDVMAVAINGKTVLVSNFGRRTFPSLGWESPEEPSQNYAGGCVLKAGDWVYLKEGEVVDLDILFGELPGGAFSAFLLIEKQGETYGELEDGERIYPVFQLAPFDTPLTEVRANGRKSAPEFAPEGPLWQGFQ